MPEEDAATTGLTGPGFRRGRDTSPAATESANDRTTDPSGVPGAARPEAQLSEGATPPSTRSAAPLVAAPASDAV